MRLDNFVASSSGLTRKEAKRAIQGGEVSVDGEPCQRAATQIRGHEQVSLAGQLLHLPGERYYMLHKPAGVVSATEDREHATVLSLFPAELRPGLRIVGRLDRDTTGLLLLTTDGHWLHRATSPRRQCPKIYQVTLPEPLAEKAIQQLESGLLLKGDDKPTRPAKVTVMDTHCIHLTLTEGRYHQVKRMLAAVGSHVETLHRVQVGDIVLDPALTPGAYRPLTAQEISQFAED